MMFKNSPKYSLRIVGNIHLNYYFACLVIYAFYVRDINMFTVAGQGHRKSRLLIDRDRVVWRVCDAVMICDGRHQCKTEILCIFVDRLPMLIFNPCLFSGFCCFLSHKKPNICMRSVFSRRIHHWFCYFYKMNNVNSMIYLKPEWMLGWVTF